MRVIDVFRGYFSSFGTSGSVLSNAVDMGKWIQFQLNEGVAPDGTEILTDVQFRVRHKRMTSSLTLRPLLFQDIHVPLIQRTASPTWVRPDHPVTYAPPMKYSTGWQETTYRGEFGVAQIKLKNLK